MLEKKTAWQRAQEEAERELAKARKEYEEMAGRGNLEDEAAGFALAWMEHLSQRPGGGLSRADVRGILKRYVD